MSSPASLLLWREKAPKVKTADAAALAASNHAAAAAAAVAAVDARPFTTRKAGRPSATQRDGKIFCPTPFVNSRKMFQVCQQTSPANHQTGGSQVLAYINLSMLVRIFVLFLPQTLNHTPFQRSSNTSLLRNKIRWMQAEHINPDKHIYNIDETTLRFYPEASSAWAERGEGSHARGDPRMQIYAREAVIILKRMSRFVPSHVPDGAKAVPGVSHWQSTERLLSLVDTAR
eukprot:1697788-Amphidinium_carterae.2